MRPLLFPLFALLLAGPGFAAPLLSRPAPGKNGDATATLDPLAGELARWPSARDAEAVLAWGLDHLDWIEANAAFDLRGSGDWQTLRDETMRRLQPWVYLREAQFRDYTDRRDSCVQRFYARRSQVALGLWYGTYDQSLDGRRAALTRLRERLGWLDYAAARLPHPGVVEMFCSID
jgi:hypothetical protein